MKLGANILFLLLSTTLAFGQDYNKGKYLIETSQIKNARKHFKDILTSNPKDSKASFFVGETYFAESKPDSAKVFYNEGLTIDPKSLLNNIGLAKLSYFTNPSEGKASLDKILQQAKSKDLDPALAIAEFYISQKEADKALEALSKPLESDTKNPEVYLLAGDAWLLKNDGNKALESYERKALSLNPENPRAIFSIGKLYVKTRNHDLGLQYFNQAIQKDAQYAPAYKEIADLYYKVGQYKKAIEAYEKYIAIADKDADSDFRYASFIFLNKDYPTALKYLSELSKNAKHKDNPYFLRLTAYSYYETGDFEKALENMNVFFTKAKQDQILSSDFEYMGKIQAKKGNSTEAINNFKKALEKDPGNSAVYIDLANQYLIDKKFQEASVAFEGKLKKSEGSPNEYLNYGKSVFYLQNFLKADSIFSILVAKIPTLPHGYLWRAKALEQVDADMKEALAKPHYEKFIEFAEKEKDKYKSDLVNAYSYMASYYAHKTNDANSSVSFWKKVKEIDPSNKYAAEALGKK